MSTRTLGLLGMVGAPFLCIDLLMHGTGSSYVSTSLGALLGLAYITGWMCSVAGLWKLKATGPSRWGRGVLFVQLLFLLLASCSNAVLALRPGTDAPVFKLLDAFWPLSNVWMLVTAVFVIRARRLEGAFRFVPLIAALWLPVSTVIMTRVADRSSTSAAVQGAYSAIAWSLLGYGVATAERRGRLVGAT